MTLYEIWYRSDWTDDVTNERQAVFTSVEKAERWLNEHINDWYKDKPTSDKWYVLVSAQWDGTKRHPKIVGTDVRVTNKLTSRQENAKKYSDYGGYIEVFTTEDQARDFARTAELRKD